MKYIVWIILMLVTVWFWFAQYSPTQADETLLETLDMKVDALMSMDRNRGVLIWNKIVKILPSIAPTSRVYYILDKLYDIIAVKAVLYSDLTGNALNTNDTQMVTTTNATTDSSTTSDNMMSPVTIELEGKNFEYSLTELRVKKWQEVTIVFDSTWWTHDWVVDEFNVATNKVSKTDWTTSVTFVPDMTWSFEFYCSVWNHRQEWMVWTLIVE